MLPRLDEWRTHTFLVRDAEFFDADVAPGQRVRDLADDARPILADQVEQEQQQQTDEVD
mgnify:CR=1 FL=1